MINLKCTKCQQYKEASVNNFYWRKDRSLWDLKCKKCISRQRKESYLKNSDSKKEKAAHYRELHREEIREKATVYNNKQETKDRTAKWRQENKDLLRQKDNNWIANNPEKYKAIVRRKSKKQRQRPNSKIKAHVSRQVNFALHRKGDSKRGNSVLKFLPFSIQELREHLEKQFESWMNWDNYGVYKKSKWDDNDLSTWSWQIDHIIPQSNFVYTSMTDSSFMLCWSLSNLRPYSAKQNIVDGSKKTRH